MKTRNQFYFEHNPPFQNQIRFNCANYRCDKMILPDNCYNCMCRDGYPHNLGGDDHCKNFKPVQKP